jgi:hypothetical protein
VRRFAERLFFRCFSRDEVTRIIKKRFNIDTLPAGLTYSQDGLYTVHNADFVIEPRFAQSYQKGKNTLSWGNADIHWRAYTACWAADKAKKLEGDFVECGVNKGGLAITVLHYAGLQHSDKNFYLLDTFSGLVEEYISEDEKKMGIKPGNYTDCYEEVKERFAPYPNVKIIKGAIPGTLEMVKAEKVAYLSIDMNCVEPEIAAAEFFWPKMVPGAVIVLDDYGWRKHIGQKKAFDAFAQARGVQVFSLPTGQGMIIKP